MPAMRSVTHPLSIDLSSHLADLSSDHQLEASTRKRQGRKAKKANTPLDLTDLHTALPTNLRRPRRTQYHASTTGTHIQQAMSVQPPSGRHVSGPMTILQRPLPMPSNQDQTMVTPHPEWNSFNAQTHGSVPVQPSWSDAPFNQSSLDKLLLLCHSDKELKKEGYVINQLTQKELNAKMRCTLCHGE
jgi:hypothetical protein